jgi:DNA-binding transcriptional LysR family regulator
MLQSMAIELMAASNRLEETMLSLHDEVVGQFLIGCSTASGKYLLPGLIADFRQIYPKVRADVLVSSRNSVLKRLLEGEVALAVSSKKIEHKELEYQEFFNDEIILVAAKNHRWASYRTIYPDDLLDEPMILREDVAGTVEVLEEGLRQQGITPDMLNIAMMLGNAEAICMAVEKQIGVAFISRLAAFRSLELGSLVEVQVENFSLRRKIYMARNTRIPATRAQNAFWDYVTQRAPDLEFPKLAFI